MEMHYSVVLGYAAGLLLLWGIGYLLLVPFRKLLKFFLSAIVGGFALFIINLVSAPLGFPLPINPLTAAIAGFLGLPGVILVAVLTFLLK